MKHAVITLFALCLFGFLVPAKAPSYKAFLHLSLKEEFATTSGWQAIAYQPQGEDADTGELPAKLCFETTPKTSPQCTSIISAPPNTDFIYHYQTVKELSVISTPHLVKMEAEFFGGGSGSLTQISFWQYHKPTDRFEVAGLITLSNQGEYQILGHGALKGVLVTADAHWQAPESHFSPHQFDVTIYRYTEETGYAKIASYLTAKKYPSLDDTDKIDVIRHELPHIEKSLSRAN